MEPHDEPEFIQKIADIREALIPWGREHHRDYPWRHTHDPYRILIAEVFLHRTRADQVSPVYIRFVQEYPDLVALCQADPVLVEELLAPLGLKWRTNLLLKMVTEICERHQGVIPMKREELLLLPGVGDYIASALLTFSGTAPEPIMDTNTVRVIGRVFGLILNDSARRKKQFREIMQALIRTGNAIEISFSMIDLAALICLPRMPCCERCPLNSLCCFAHVNRNDIGKPQENEAR